MITKDIISKKSFHTSKKKYSCQFFLLSLLLMTVLSAEESPVSGKIFYPPVRDCILHTGEGFADPMYYHSYGSRKYHSGEDYILEWRNEHIISGIQDTESLEKLHEKTFGYLPPADTFSEKDYPEYLKINLYRTGADITDTRIGLYPRSRDDAAYGYGQEVHSVYDGTVEEETSPSEPKGWGKALLIRHDAPPGYAFEIYWEGKMRKLKSFWTQYSHTLKNLKVRGDRVKKGEAVAEIGDGNGIFNTMTGSAFIKEGAHLHFEIRIRKSSLFPDKSLLSNEKKLKETHISPSYFLKNAVLVRDEK
ncbi:MAG TPA: M23 family metallopeptidase [Leptospiraceae bacterium]|nr:M23 family metallopeptidase [Leptospiraceae bacterium]HNF13367.1 M23 family metallopeptidase [Leptospiraceae bacterium]HNF25797.1 M23 family metallopeptidase [Leptospiraceae bacterium]HNI94741.1 M23 family metallopeptidase [Leptospiraceae bacterium]HNM02823.1 M23 family metallopeptidase [Leptospiraceae bacterium]